MQINVHFFWEKGSKVGYILITWKVCNEHPNNVVWNVIEDF